MTQCHAGIKEGKGSLLSPLRHREDLTMCSLHGSFLLFPPHNTSQPLAFSRSRSSTCLLPRVHLSLSGYSAIHLEEANTANTISLHSHLFCSHSLSYQRLSLICLCAFSFSLCQSTRRTIYVTLPMSVSKSGLHRSSQWREMCWCISKQDATGRTDVCPAARQSNLATICPCSGPLSNNR